MITKGKTEQLLDKLNSKTRIDKSSGCWLWTGGKSDGYGHFTLNGEVYWVHRLSAAIFLRLDSNRKGEHALHKAICPNKNCWNPIHLYLGSSKDNVRDRKSMNRNLGGVKYGTHCKRGHELTRSNTYANRGCKICHKERWEERKRIIC